MLITSLNNICKEFIFFFKIFKYANGDTYEGIFKMDQKDGEGVFNNIKNEKNVKRLLILKILTKNKKDFLICLWKNWKIIMEGWLKN